jgi:hypothetical protein
MCPYGEWDEVKSQCAFLTENNACKIYNRIKHDQVSPAMGAGCVSTLGNTVREEKIKAMGKVV